MNEVFVACNVNVQLLNFNSIPITHTHTYILAHFYLKYNLPD